MNLLHLVFVVVDFLLFLFIFLLFFSIIFLLLLIVPTSQLQFMWLREDVVDMLGQCRDEELFFPTTDFDHDRLIRLGSQSDLKAGM